MTALERRVQRVTRGALDGSYGPDRGRPLVASFNVGDVIELRPLGTRRGVRLSLFDTYRYAVRCQVAAVERRAKELQKTNGGRLASARKQARAELAA